MLPLLAVVVIAGCSAHRTAPVAPTPPAGSASSSTAAVPAPSTSEPAPTTSSAAPVPSNSPAAEGPSTSAEPTPCADDDLAIANGEVASANTLRHVTVSFTNTSSHPCTLTGYPGADLVTAAGGVLVHVTRRPQNAAPHLTLDPGEVANADVEAYAIDTATGNGCPRVGTLVITPPNGFQSHTLAVNLPICTASISSVT
ncbi:MAG TPA: DUF4232 domain-containing protein [Mycobacterium sp.]